MTQQRFYVTPVLDSVPLLDSNPRPSGIWGIKWKSERERKAGRTLPEEFNLGNIPHVWAHCTLTTVHGSLFHATVLWKKNSIETINLKMILNQPKNVGDSLP